MSLGLGYNNSTTKNTNQFSNQSSQNGTSSTNRNLTPFQSASQAPLFNYISSLMTNPSATIAPFQNQARNDVNSNYNGLSDSLRQQFMSTGGGSSGKYGMAQTQGTLARVGQLSNVDNQFQQTAAQLPLQASQIMESLLGMNFGSTTNASQTGTQSGNSSGTSNTSGFSLSASGGPPGLSSWR